MENKMILSRNSTIEYLLMALPILSIATMFLYGVSSFEKIALIVEFIILLTIAFLSDVFSNRIFFSIFIVNLYSVVMTVVFHSGLGVALTFINLLLLLFVVEKIRISEKVLLTIYFEMAISLFVFLITSKFSVAYSGTVYNVLGAGYNVNFFALLSLCCWFSWIVFLDKVTWNKHVVRIVALIVTAVCLFFIYIARSRSVYLAVLLFVFLNIVYKKPISSKNLSLIVRLIVLFSIVFVGVYLYLYRHFENITVLGKSLYTGRQVVWNSAWECFVRSPIIGIGTDSLLENRGGTTIDSAHNTIMSLLYTLGLIPSITFVALLGHNYKSNLNYSLKSQLAFISSLIITFFESFYTDSHLYIFYLFLLLGFSAESEKDGKCSDT